MKIKNFFINGKKSKISKEALSEDVVNSMLPPRSVEDTGKAVVVGEDGGYELADVLPAATAADAGKAVMVAEDGSYALAEAGGKPVIATFTQYGPDWKVNKEFDVMLEACQAGNIIFRQFDGNYSRLTTTNYALRSSPTYKVIDVYFCNDTALNWFRIENGTITRTAKQFSFTS